MILWRLTQDWDGLPEGACFSEFRYKTIFYLDRPLFEPIQAYEIKDMIKYDDEKYCILHNIEFLLFYNETELNKFLNKEHESKITR